MACEFICDSCWKRALVTCGPCGWLSPSGWFEDAASRKVACSQECWDKLRKAKAGEHDEEEMRWGLRDSLTGGFLRVDGTLSLEKGSIYRSWPDKQEAVKVLGRFDDDDLIVKEIPPGLLKMPDIGEETSGEEMGYGP